MIMNLLHLKYAIEVEKTSSITKAAENLYMGQPNLSRAIRELEASLGVTLFKRTKKGVIPTLEGEEFLACAKKILAQLDTAENMFKEDRALKQRLSISVPRADYISAAFTDFVKKLDPDCPVEIFYKETNSQRAVNNILSSEFNLAILRYQTSYDRQYKAMLEDKGLTSELVFEFEPVVIMSKNNPLAGSDSVSESELSDFVEIIHGDPYVPSLPVSEVRREEESGTDRHIYVFERGSQMELLSETDDSFMRVSPVPQKILDRFSLVQKKLEGCTKRYRDVLVYKENYRLTPLDRAFIDELTAVRRSIDTEK